MSKCSDRMAWSATGPTSASDGVRMPPVRITVGAPGACCMTSITRIEFVTMVRSRTWVMRCASAKVVVPPESAIAVPGRTNRAAATAMASFSESSRDDFASKPGSSMLGVDAMVAPAVHLLDQPVTRQTSRSRRTVMSETLRSSVSSLTRTPAGAPDVLQDHRLTLFG